MYEFMMYSGAHKSLGAIKECDINIRDIGHSLSNICRFAGHTSNFYSVAEHSLLTMACLEFMGVKISAKLKLLALIHDANECYVGDIIRPVEELIGVDVFHLKERFMNKIWNAFELAVTTEELMIVKAADNIMLDIEGRYFFGNNWTQEPQAWPLKIFCYRPDVVKLHFMKGFQNVYQGYVEENKMVTGKAGK
jgi:hypothetical protein